MRLRYIDPWSAVVNGFAMSPLWRPGARAVLLRRMGLLIGEGTLVQRCLIGSRNVSIGAHSYIGPECQLDGTERIVIGDHVALANRVIVLTSSHDHSDPTHRAGVSKNAPTTIGDGAWLGAGVMVLAGVNIAEGCVVAAGSVVTSDCEPNGLYAGVPATRRRSLPAPPDREPR